MCLQDMLDRTKVKEGGIYAFVELHIEQGPVLEKAREELGVVTAIAAVRPPSCYAGRPTMMDTQGCT